MASITPDIDLAPWGVLDWPRPADSVTVDKDLAREVLTSFRPDLGPEARLTTLSKGSNAQSWVVGPHGGRRLVLRCALGNDAEGALAAMAGAALAVAGAGLITKTPLPAADGSFAVRDRAGRAWQCWTWVDGHHPVGSLAEASLLGATLRRFHRALEEWLREGPPAHDPYWPERFDRIDVVEALDRLRPSFAVRVDRELVVAACGSAVAPTVLEPSAGHGDCHTDNWVVLAEGAGAALFDLELIGTRPGAQPTDLGVLMHRMARLAAAVPTPGRVEAAAAAALALADSYGADAGAIAVALGCAIHESLAKLVGCALDGPPGLDGQARLAIAANHCVYLCELVALKGALEGRAG
jgi:Ser/Thr protein kinase RdoA (MazF antagonist)